MSKTAYHLQLKGSVGGADFDRKAVDNILEKNQGKQVNVLIDSTGGNLTTGLSITSAFKKHGNVSVHFVSLNASDTTTTRSTTSRSSRSDLPDKGPYCGEWGCEVIGWPLSQLAEKENFARHIVGSCYNLESRMRDHQHYFDYEAYC